MKYLSTPRTILDMGCGTGRTTTHLKTIGHTLIGVDVAPNMICAARDKHPDIDFMVGDASDIRFRDGYFDAVLFSFNGLDCLYPYKNRVKAMNEINRVLKPDGLFIYSSHKIEAMLSWRAAKRIRLYDYPYFKEHTVYGDLILYYGTDKANRLQQAKTGYRLLETVDYKKHSWRYYVCQKC